MPLSLLVTTVGVTVSMGVSLLSVCIVERIIECTVTNEGNLGSKGRIFDFTPVRKCAKKRVFLCLWS